MILTDKEIRTLCTIEGQMVYPYLNMQVRGLKDETMDPLGPYRKVISYGLSSMGYDIRLAGDEFKVFSPIQGSVIDPKDFNPKTLIEAPVRATFEHEYFLIPPHSYALGLTFESFNMPEDILGICLGKSTYARCGLIVNATPLEPGWKGRLVIELANTANLPIRVYIGEGIAQVMFFRSNTRPETTYNDRSGKYQEQKGLVLAKV